MILKLTLDLPEEQGYVRIMRLLGRTLLENLKAVDQDIDEIELVMGELCANVVRHARSHEQRFRVSLEYDADHVVVTVADSGTGFVADEIAPVGSERPDFKGQPQRIGGYGLRLVELLSDRLEFQRSDPSGTTVRAEKRLHYKTQADADYARSLTHVAGMSGNVSDGMSTTLDGE
jgi:anti-sigma regulatory factor (Ser/Thr protein kinase)